MPPLGCSWNSFLPFAVFHFLIVVLGPAGLMALVPNAGFSPTFETATQALSPPVSEIKDPNRRQTPPCGSINTSTTAQIQINPARQEFLPVMRDCFISRPALIQKLLRATGTRRNLMQVFNSSGI